MKIATSPVFGTLAMTAALGLGAPAAMAAPLPAVSVANESYAAPLFDSEAENVEGWGRGYRDHRDYRRGRGIDGGDVLAGILILGGVVAVAKAMENDRDRDYRSYPDRDYRDRSYDYDNDMRDRSYRTDDYNRDYDRDRRAYYDQDGTRRGVNGAVDQCVEEVDRVARVASVDVADRDASGWTIAGELSGGGRYECEFDAGGQLRDVDIDDDDARGMHTDVDTRYSDDYYARARSEIEHSRSEGGEYDADSPSNWSEDEPRDDYYYADPIR